MDAPQPLTYLFTFKMELIGYCTTLGCALLGQGCGWYWLFYRCGCIDYEQERVHTQPPPPPPRAPPRDYNPFESPNGAPKDPHLQPAYR